MEDDFKMMIIRYFSFFLVFKISYAVVVVVQIIAIVFIFGGAMEKYSDDRKKKKIKIKKTFP